MFAVIWGLMLRRHLLRCQIEAFTGVKNGAVIAQSVWRLGSGLDDRGSRVRFPAGARNIYLHYRVQNGSAVAGALSLGVKWPGREADHSPPSSAEVKERVELYLHSPSTPSWRDAHLKKYRENFTFCGGEVVVAVSGS
jgi:hypothetical protein